MTPMIYFVHEPGGVLGPYWSIMEAWKHLIAGHIIPYVIPKEFNNVLREAYLSQTPKVRPQEATNLQMQNLLDPMEQPQHFNQD